MDSVIEDAIAIHVDTEGMDAETIQSIEDAIEWAFARRTQNRHSTATGVLESSK